MKDIAEFSTLVGHIYDCATEPDKWPIFLEDFCWRIGAEGGSIHIADPITSANQVLVEHGVDTEWSALGRATYAAMSPVGAAVLLADVEQPVSVFDFVDEDEYLESRFYREWLAPKGYFDMMGALIVKKRGEIGAISAVRLREKGRYTQEERAFVALVAPHVRRAVTISGFLEHRRCDLETLTSFVDTLSTAIVFIDDRSRLLRTNPAADDLLASGDVIRARDGVLSLCDRRADHQLRARLSLQDREALLLSLARDSGPIGVTLMPLKQRLFAVFIKAVEPDTPAVGKLLAQAFNLTPREVSVLMPMLQGRSLQEVADSLGIGSATARTHLNRLFAKTSANRQGELIARVMQILPGM